MKNKKFEDTVKPGDGIIICSPFSSEKQMKENFTFIGFEPCSVCGSKCSGKIQLLTSTNKKIKGCFRFGQNIRLKIVKHFLPDNLFEI